MVAACAPASGGWRLMGLSRSWRLGEPVSRLEAGGPVSRLEAGGGGGLLAWSLVQGGDICFYHAVECWQIIFCVGFLGGSTQLEVIWFTVHLFCKSCICQCLCSHSPVVTVDFLEMVFMFTCLFSWSS